MQSHAIFMSDHGFAGRHFNFLRKRFGTRKYKILEIRRNSGENLSFDQRIYGKVLCSHLKVILLGLNIAMLIFYLEPLYVI
jgi:hypothetical protein